MARIYLSLSDMGDNATESDLERWADFVESHMDLERWADFVESHIEGDDVDVRVCTEDGHIEGDDDYDTLRVSINNLWYRGCAEGSK